MKAVFALFGLLTASHALHAADLAQIYRAAQDNDPTFAAARATLDAGREKAPQGLSGLLPSLTLSGNTVWNDSDVTQRSTGAVVNYSYNTHGYTLALSQPVFRWQNWIGYDQAKLQVAQAEAVFAQARQDLILRVAQAYFDVLYASESLSAVRTNKLAITQQLELAKKSFEVGSATITDTHEAQARYDLASAQEIAAESELEIRQRALQAIIGEPAGPLAPTRKDALLQPPQPADMTAWVGSAETNSLGVQQQQLATTIAEREVDRQRAGHYPTIDLVANKGNATALTAGIQTESDFRNVGLQIAIPLYQGGAVVSKQREAVANRSAAQSNLEVAKRGAALSARQYYLGVVNGLAQVRALQAALTSSQLALESNKLGYEVGVRINIDVLNAENQVYVTRRDLARATLDTLLAQLRLKAATGALGEDDVQAINALLDASAAQ